MSKEQTTNAGIDPVDQSEEVLCTIECTKPSGKRSRGDAVVLTNKHIYKDGIDFTGQRTRKIVRVDAVSAVSCGTERNGWYLLIGLTFLALCCVLAVYFLPGSKLLRLVLGLVCLGIGLAVAILSVIAFCRFTVKTVLVTYTGGKLKIASAGLSDKEAEDFAKQILKAGGV